LVWMWTSRRWRDAVMLTRLYRMVRHRASCKGRRVMAKSITYVGLDVHKETLAVALAEAGSRGEVREHGEFPNTPYLGRR
jgi:hypothetical protein